MAVIVDLDMCCRIRLVHSPAHEFENARNPRDDRRLAPALWLAKADQRVTLESAVEGRARALAAVGFAPLDAPHTALAEAASARWLVTTDDRLVRLGQRSGLGLRTEIANPTLVVQALSGGTP